MTRDLLQKVDFLHHLFDTIPSFIFIVDPDVRILLHQGFWALTKNWSF